MIPVGDLIPTRTRPALTGALAVAALALIVPPGLRPWTVAWAVDALAIWIFGRTLEDRMGHARFAALAALGAAAGAAVPALVTAVPATFAAAGGLAAALFGAYLSRFPGAPVLALVPVPFRLQVIEIPAWFVAALWGVVHLAAALGADTGSATVALLTGWLAAGALGGALVRPLSLRERDDPDWWGA